MDKWSLLQGLQIQSSEKHAIYVFISFLLYIYSLKCKAGYKYQKIYNEAVGIFVMQPLALRSVNPHNSFCNSNCWYQFISCNTPFVIKGLKSFCNNEVKFAKNQMTLHNAQKSAILATYFGFREILILARGKNWPGLVRPLLQLPKQVQ